MLQAYPELYSTYLNILVRRYRLRATTKESSTFQQVLATFLGEAGENLPSRRDYLSRFTTVLYDPLRKAPMLWTPWDPSEQATDDVWRSRVAVLAHEATHFEQMERDGGERFSLKYLSSRRHRAAYEVEAYLAGIAAELHLEEGTIDIRPWEDLSPPLFQRVQNGAKSAKEALSSAYGLSPRSQWWAKARIDACIDHLSSSVTCRNLQGLSGGSDALSLLRLALHSHKRTHA